MAIRYSGTLRVYIRAMDKGGLDGRYYYAGSVTDGQGNRWAFSDLSPSPMHTPGPERLAIDNPKAYDRAAADALVWAWSATREDMGGEGWVFDGGEFHPDHETEDRFQVSRSPMGEPVWPV
jgi:hypothetical protein